jgi:PAS domain S-box-containing protein
MHTSIKTRDHLAKGSMAISKLLSLLAAALPLLAAAGWIFDIPRLTKIHAALPAMQPNTALGLVLAAIATLFMGHDQRSRKSSLAVSAIAAIVVLLGALTLSEYLLGWDFRIDRIFIMSDAFRAYPGRPSPQTSANFVLLGISLFIYNLRSLPIRYGQVLAVATAANAIVAITGYIFSTAEFYGFPFVASDIGMAVHTAASFILITAALLCSRPSEGMMSLVTSDTRSGRMARQVLLTSVLAPPLVGALTKLGVFAGWYDVSVQVSLFVVVLLGLVLRTTWQAATQSEEGELRARAAFEQIQSVNARLKKALDERRIFEALIENSSDFIGIADVNGKPVYLNSAGRRMVGLPDDYPIENTQIPDYYCPGQRSFASDVIVRSMHEQGHWKGETCFRHWQTQEAIPVSDEHFMIRAGDTGRLLGMGTVTRDISDVKRIESEQRFLAEIGPVLASTLDDENAFTNVAQLVVRDLADLCIVDVVEDNGAVRRLKVMSRDPSMASLCDSLMRIAPDGSSSYLSRMILENQRSVLIERLSSDISISSSQAGEELAVLLAARFQSAVAVPLLARGKLVGIIALLSAASSRNYGPADVRLAEELAQRAALSIENARLFGEAQRAVKTREDVLAVVSHDLKNPVTTISLAVHLLRRLEGIDADKLREVADKIQRAVDRMLLLIADLLDFAKIDSGTFSVEPRPVQLANAIGPAIDGQKVLAEARQQTLEVRLPAALPEVAVDARRIGQVISNLLGNAIKFTPEGGRIQVSARQQGNKIIVSVSDAGPGIRPEHLPRVFDRFWQAEGARDIGSGLGLSITRGIIDAHGGTIWVESQLGKGSSFYFTLPVVDLKTQRTDNAA